MTQIEELVIRVPGMDLAEGRALGQEVAALVAEALPDNVGDYKIPGLSVKINKDQLSSPGTMAPAIAKQIILQIRLATI